MASSWQVKRVVLGKKSEPTQKETRVQGTRETPGLLLPDQRKALKAEECTHGGHKGRDETPWENKAGQHQKLPQSPTSPPLSPTHQLPAFLRIKCTSL